MTCFAAFNVPIINSGDPLAEGFGYHAVDIEINGEKFILQHLLKPRDIVFDVGAHEGNWSSIALQIEPKIQLFCFEPTVKSFCTLKTRIHFPSRTYLVALSNEIGLKPFYCTRRDEDSAGNGFFLHPHLKQDSRIIEVQSDTLDRFCSSNNIRQIDYLKIDTEGTELMVLEGAKTLLTNHQISALQFEYGGTYLHGNVSLKQIVQLLTQAGYSIFRLSPDGIIHVPEWKDSLENYFYANYLAVVGSQVPQFKPIQNLGFESGQKSVAQSRLDRGRFQ